MTTQLVGEGLRAWPVFDQEAATQRFQRLQELLSGTLSTPDRPMQRRTAERAVLPSLLERAQSVAQLRRTELDAMAEAAEAVLGPNEFRDPLVSSCRALSQFSELMEKPAETRNPSDVSTVTSRLQLCSRSQLARTDDEKLVKTARLVRVGAGSTVLIEPSTYVYILSGEVRLCIGSRSSSRKCSRRASRNEEDGSSDKNSSATAGAHCTRPGSEPENQVLIAGQSTFSPRYTSEYTASVDTKVLLLGCDSYTTIAWNMAYRHWCAAVYWVEVAFSPEFAGSQLLTRVASHFVSVMTMRGDEILCQPGEMMSTLYLIVSGYIAMEKFLTVETAEEWVQVYKVGPGSLVGIEGLNAQRRAPYRARALGPVKMMAMPFCNYVECFEKGEGLGLKQRLLEHYERLYSAESIITHARCRTDWGYFRTVVAADAIARAELKKMPAALPSEGVLAPGDRLALYDRPPPPGVSLDPPGPGWEFRTAVTDETPLTDESQNGISEDLHGEGLQVMTPHERRIIYHPILTTHSELTDPTVDHKIERVKRRAGLLRRSRSVVESDEFGRVCAASNEQPPRDVSQVKSLNQLCWENQRVLNAIFVSN